MYHKGDHIGGDRKGNSKYMPLRAILGGEFAPKWLTLPLLTELPRRVGFSESPLIHEGIKLL
jgi:hypothetical protein